MPQHDTLHFTDRGLYCPAGDFHIDPWRPVPRALITHGHADHARFGHGSYLATDIAAPVLRHRLGDIAVDTVRYGTSLTVGGARVSFHPAGHVPGSAQIRVEVAGQVWVVSGDYKLENDSLSTPFEPVRCHAFISECTFGLPVFRWRPQAEIAAQIAGWWRDCAAQGRTAVLGAYSLGKAQRLLSLLDPAQGPILCHSSIEDTTDVLRAQGLALPPTIRATADTGAKSHPGALVMTPPSAMAGTWLKRYGPVSTAFASGWMALRGVRRRRGADREFVISDHADWDGLNRAVAATGAERVFATHGYTDVFARWLASSGIDARPVQTEFGTADADAAETPEPAQAQADPSADGSGTAAPGGAGRIAARD
ncbi:ligase-associated DNA damage response exonuclease [Meridianimarinicoccus roseus]|uniref:Ligase-associated DNA damage response exonuclease n=1 Tax=Meridianimarinicoccus roseus TaxID=2072018 RepID=A0A2V2LLZ8_9RHOB|nr:ligase-associated DNA damage response exonuclease [Meridianimarinicoccus roseus]PWR04087.1 ligase-associated DNA damage response exonuclease [Meridianimarinicoccus roseus]